VSGQKSNNSGSKNKRMQAVRSKNTSIEKILGSALWELGLRYRKHPSSVIGKPDIAFMKKKIAIFCDSEFWHAKELKKTLDSIKTNRSFWTEKLKRNKKRDAFVNEKLIERGWIVLRFWGQDLNNRLDDCVQAILNSYYKEEILSNEREIEGH
jgi:DNA mismatch endonuclease, patch repair protein